jgi:hypothetical protein
MKRAVTMVLVVGALAAAGAYEWRYSADMQEHIDTVNHDLEGARSDALYANGLIGSLQAMTAQTEVGGEIISTHEHVHTLKDEVLAWKIRRALDREGMTVGGAIQTAISIWPESQ